MVKEPSLGGLYEARDSYENMIISDSKLCELLSPQVQLMSYQVKYLCGCNFYLQIPLQASINAWILIHIISIEQSSEYRGQARSSGVFQERISTYRGCVFPMVVIFINVYQMLYCIHYVHV